MAEALPNEANPASSAAPPPERKPRKKRHFWLWLILLLILLGFVVLAWLRRQKPKAPPPPPVAVSTTNVQKGDIPVAVTALGSVLPISVVGISPRVDGQLVRIDYEEGQLVKSNALLAVIDPEPFYAAEIQAEGQLARDQAFLEGARIDLDRYRAAFTRKAVPEQQVADQVALVRQYEGTVKLDQGVLSNAQVQLAYCYLHSPVAGRIGLRLVDPGNIVHAANTNALLSIVQLQPITVIFSVSEEFLPQIQDQVRAGHAMTVEAYDRTQTHKLETGAFLTLDNQIDQATGTIRIKGIFTNEDLMLFPNQFVNARLIIQILRDQLLVPTYSIQRNPEGAFVYVITNRVMDQVVTNKNIVVTNHVTVEAVTMRNIKVDVTDHDTSSVEGLQPGEVIATDNFNKLGEGVRVTTHATNETARGSATSPQAPVNTGRTTLPLK